MDAVNQLSILNILNTLNLEHGGALNGCCEYVVNSKHSKYSEFGHSESALNSKHWWCFEWWCFGRCESAVNSKHSEHSEFGTWWCFEWML